MNSSTRIDCQQLDHLLSHAQEAYLAFTLPDQDLIFASASFETVFGYPAERFTTDRGFFREVVHPEDLDRAMEATNTTMREGTGELDHRIILPDGRVRWLHRQSWVTYDELGQPVQVNDIASDITRFKEMEESLRVSEELHRQTLSSISDAIFVTDSDGQFTFVCPNVNTTFGYSQAEAEAFGVIDRLLGDDLFDRNALESAGELKNIQRRILDKAGQPHDLLISVKRVSIGRGTTLYACRDVTEFVRLADTVTEQERRQRDLFEHLQTVVWSGDLETRQVKYLNPAARILYGRTEQEFYENPELWSQVVHPDDAPGVPDFCAMLVEHGACGAEYRIVRPDGEVRWVHDVAWLSHDAHGTVVMEGIVTDITERKDAELELRESQRLLNDIFENSGSIIFVKDRDGRYVRVNRKWEEVNHLRRDIALGRADQELFGADTARQFRSNDLLVMEGGIVLRTEESNLDNDTWRNTITVKFPLWGADGAISGLCGMVTDITERTEAEAALRASEEKYRSLVESTDAAIALVDEAGHVLVANDIAVKLYGRELDSSKQWDIADLMPPERVEVLMADVHQVIATGEGLIREHEQEFPSGRRWFRSSVQPVLNADGQPYAGLVYGTDMTDAKHLEAALRASEELYRSLLDSSDDEIALIDGEGRYLFANHDMFGVATEPAVDLVGKTLFDRFTPEAAQGYLAQVREVIGSDRGKVLESSYFVRGKTRWFRNSFQPVHDATGTVYAVLVSSNDVTDRREAEARILAQNRILHQAHELIALSQMDGTITYLNPVGMAMIGASSAEDVIGQPISRYTMPAFHELVVETGYPQAFEQGYWRHEGQLKSLTGRAIDVDVTIFPVRDSDGQILHMAAMATDISERKRAEEFLRASEEGFRLLFQSNPLPMWVFSEETRRFLEVNDAAIAHYGYSRDEFLAMTIQDIRPLSDRSRLDAFLRAERPDMRHSGQWRHIVKDGRIIEVDVTDHWLQFAGQPAVMVVANDVTERNRAHEALRASEERYRSLLESSDSSICLLDEDGFVLFANAQEAEQHGLTPDQMTGKAVQDIFPPEEAVPLVADVREVIHSSVGKVTEVEVRRLGEKRWYRVSIQPVRSAVGVPYAALVYATEVTEARVAAAALRASEEKYRSLVSSVASGISVVDAEGLYLFVNEVGAQLRGCKPEEMIGHHLADIMPLDQAEAFLEDIRQTIRENKGFQKEVQRELRDGIHWVQVNVQPVLDAEGVPYAALSLANDVTAVKQAQLALQASEAQYRLLADNMADVVWILDLNTARFTFVSPSVEQLRGYTPEEVLQQQMDEVMTSESAALIARELPARIQAFLAGDESAGTGLAQIEQLCRDGSTVWTEVVTRLLVEDDGSLKVLGVSRDISERLRAEKALRQSEAQYRLLAENMADVIWMYDIQANQYLYFTPSVTSLFGYTPHEAIHQPLEGSMTPESLERVRQTLPSRVNAWLAGDESQTSQREELEQIRKDGTTVWTEVMTTLVRDERGVPCLLGVTRDISERKKAEDALQSSLEREHAILKGIPDLMFRLDADGTFLDYSAPSDDELAFSPNDFLGKSIHQLFPSDMAQPFMEAVTSALREKQPQRLEYQMQILGRTVDYECRDVPLSDGTVLSIIRDITERKQAVERINRLNRTLAMISEVNEAVARIRQPAKLFERTCQIAAETGGYRLAWVGLLDPETREVQRAAFTGSDERDAEFLAGLNIVLDGSWRGNAPPGLAMMTGEHQICNDMANDPRFVQRREQALEHGFRASASFPLKVGAEVRAVLTLTASQPGYFTDEEVRLLDDMAANISFALAFAEEEAQRLQAERQVLAQNALLHQSRELIAMSDLQGKLTFINHAGIEMLGAADASGVLGSTVAEFLGPEDTERILTRVLPAVMVGGYWRGENQLKRPDGRLIPVEQTIFPIQDASGQITQLATIMTDITERKKAVDALRTSEERYRSLVESSDSAIAVFDAQGVIHFANEVALRQLRVSADTLVGKTMKELFPPKLAHRQLTAVRRVIRTGKGEVNERETVVGGASRWYHTSVQPIRDASGQVTTVLVNTSDITRFKQAEQTVRRSEQQLRGLIESQTNYVIRTNLDRKFLYWNQKFEEDYGWIYGSKGLAGGIALDSTCEYHHERARQAASACMAEPGRVVRVELDKPAPDGTTRATLWEFICLTDDQGKPSEIQSMGIDITDRVKAERALRASEEQFKSFMRYLPAEIWIADDQDRLVYCNELFATLNGRAPESVFGLLMRDLVHSEMVEQVLRENAEIRDAHHVLHPQYAWPSADGTERFWSLTKFPIYRENQPPLVGAIGMDVTREHLAEAALRASEEQFKAFMNYLPAEIWIADEQDRLVYCNNQYPGLDGSSPETIMGRPLSELISSPLRERVLQQNAVVRAEQRVMNLTFTRTEDENGESFWSLTKFPILRENQPPLIGAIGIDVTREHLAQVALRTSEEQFKAFMHYLPGETWIADEHDQLVYCNSQFAVRKGGSPDSVKGRHVSELLIGAPPEQVMEENAVVRNQQRVLEIQFSRFNSEGEESYWSLTKFPILRDDQSPLVGAIGMDVTRQYQAEAALRASEEQFQLFMEYLPANIWILDDQDHVVYTNRRYAEAMGGSIHDLLGKPIEELFPPDMVKAVQRENAEARAANKAVEFTSIQMGRNAERTDWQVIKFPIHRPGRSSYLGAIMLDVTKEKAAEHALQEAHDQLEQRVIERTAELERLNDRLEAIISHSGDGIVLLHRDRGIEQTNFAFGQTFGVDPDGYVGRCLESFFVPDDAAAVERGLSEVAQRHATRNVEAQALDSRGEMRTIELSIAPVNRSERDVSHLVCILRDITERKKLEAALKQQFAQLDAFFTLSLDLLCIVDTKGHFVKVNQAWEDLLGLPVHELEGREYHDFIHPDDAIATTNVVAEAGQSPITQFINRYRAKDGTYRTIEWYAQPQGDYIYAAARDITERMRVDEELRASEERYRTTLTAMSEGLVIQDLNGAIRFSNKAAERILGLPSQQLEGRTFFDRDWHAVHEDGSHFPGEMHPAIRTLRTGQPTIGEVMGVPRPDGGLGWILVSAEPLLDAQHVMSSVVVTFTDITEMKRAQAQLEEKHREELEMQDSLKALHTATIQLTHLETLDEFCRVTIEQGLTRFGFDRMGMLLLDENGDAVGTYGTDADGHIVDEHELRLNPADLTGILKRTLDRRERFVFEEDVQLYANHNMRLIGRGQVAVAALWDGKALGWLTIDNAIQHKPLSVAQLETLALYAVTVGSLLARKQSEDRASALSQRLELAAEASGLGIWDWNLLDDEILWDKGMGTLYGLSESERVHLSDPWSLFVHPDDLPVMRREFARTIGHENECDLEFRIIRRDGAERYLRSRSIVLRDERGAAVRMIGVNLDITATKNAELALRSALAKEKELGDLKSRFVSMASHEFRTPLAAILATTETLANYRSRMDDAAIDARLNKIHMQVNHMTDIMEDVLNLARLQAGRVEYRPVRGDFYVLCREIVDEFEGQALYRGRIQFECPDHPVLLEFDSKLMRHVIGNLVHNALKYSGTERQVFVSLVQDGRQATLVVRDQGIGIPPDDLVHLFEPFHRARNVGVIAGTGLGLSIAQHAVEAHRGTIKVESVVNQGTTFTVTLPKEMAGARDHA
ncbi:MAG: PAS domain S-box protein [Anaerolineae bacterium]